MKGIMFLEDKNMQTNYRLGFAQAHGNAGFITRRLSGAVIRHHKIIRGGNAINGSLKPVLSKTIFGDVVNIVGRT